MPRAKWIGSSRQAELVATDGEFNARRGIENARSGHSVFNAILKFRVSEPNAVGHRTSIEIHSHYVVSGEWSALANG